MATTIKVHVNFDDVTPCSFSRSKHFSEIPIPCLPNRVTPFRPWKTLELAQKRKPKTIPNIWSFKLCYVNFMKSMSVFHILSSHLQIEILYLFLSKWPACKSLFPRNTLEWPFAKVNSLNFANFPPRESFLNITFFFPVFKS